jgi:hypothetical protein
MRERKRPALVVINVDPINLQAGRPIRGQAPVERRKLRSTGGTPATPEAQDDDVTPMLGQPHIATRYGVQRKVRGLMRQERIRSVREYRRAQRDCGQPQPHMTLHCAFRPLQAQEISFCKTCACERILHAP